MNDIEYFKETLYKNSKGFVSLAFSKNEQWNEYIYRIKELGTQMTLFESTKNLNIYSSVNTFYNPKRNFENLYSLNALFCDIDCVRHNISIKEAYKELVKLWISDIIPEPSLVINSGNGLHIYWYLETCYASTKNKVSFVPTYQALLNAFSKKLAFLGADFKTAEPSRVLGVPSTYNIKSQTERKIIHPNLNLIEKGILHDKKIRYKIIELAQTYLIKRERKERTAYEKRAVKFNELTLSHTRMEDYRKLIHLRNRNNVYEGYRNQLLYNYGLENIDYTKTKLNLQNSLAEINNMLIKPVTEKELGGIVKSLEKSKFKKIRNQTIIEQLEISESEQTKMSILIEKGIKIYRNITQKKEKRRNENNLTRREQSKKDNIFLILDSYYLQNRKRKEIADNLKISVNTINSYLDNKITLKEKVIFLIERNESKRNIMKKLNITQYSLDRILKN